MHRAASGSPLRVALIIPTMDLGGAEKQVALLALGLHEQGHHVEVVLLTRDGPRSDSLRKAGVPVTVIGKQFKADPRALFRLIRFLRRQSFHVAHTFLFAANAFGRLAALKAGVPVVIGSERCVDPWKRTWHFAIDRFLAARSHGITSNSAGVRDFYVANGIPSEHFTLIPNGVPQPVAREPVSRGEALSRLSIPEESQLILSVGRLWPQKRVRDLIWAGELVATVREKVHLVVVGDGPQRSDLLGHRDRVSTVDHVTFTGWRDDVVDILPHADLYWIASEYEGQSNAVIEAMQAGVPVVASDIPGNRDLVEHDNTGLLFPVGDTADLARQSLRLLKEEGLADRLRDAARGRIQQDFQVDTMVARHVELYRRCLRDLHP
ncbi:MAG: glycosyltransferase [Planctomycetota bacterium]